MKNLHATKTHTHTHSRNATVYFYFIFSSNKFACFICRSENETAFYSNIVRNCSLTRYFMLVWCVCVCVGCLFCVACSMRTRHYTQAADEKTTKEKQNVTKSHLQTHVAASTKRESYLSLPRMASGKPTATNCPENSCLLICQTSWKGTK